MSAPKYIKHKGIIRTMQPGRLEVEVIVESACGSCHARRACALAETQNKTIEIELPEARRALYSIGETVNVLLKPAQGHVALFYGYILPLALFLLALFFFTAVFRNEITAGMSALGLLIPYYLILTLFQKQMKKFFAFDIEKWKPGI